MGQRVRARRLQRQIEYYELTTQSDGFAGETINETLLTRYWAEIRSVNTSRSATDLAELGITDFSEVYSVIVRSKVEWDEPKTYAIKFKGKRLEVLTIKNVDLRGTKTELIVREYRR